MATPCCGGPAALPQCGGPCSLPSAWGRAGAPDAQPGRRDAPGPQAQLLRPLPPPCSELHPRRRAGRCCLPRRDQQRYLPAGPQPAGWELATSLCPGPWADAAEVSSCPHPESGALAPTPDLPGPCAEWGLSGPGTAAGPEQTGQSPSILKADCPVQLGPALPTGPVLILEAPLYTWVFPSTLCLTRLLHHLC